LATIRSRSFRIDFHYPSADVALAWLNEAGVEQPELALAQAGGAPLAAVELVASPFWPRRAQLARLLSSNKIHSTEILRAVNPEEAPLLCGFLYSWCYDLLALRLGGRTRYNTDYAKPLSALAVTINVIHVQGFLKEIAIASRYLDHPLNQRLVCERLAINYTRAMQPDSRTQPAEEMS
jgi:DNA polymerase-3 subunit delta'